MLAFYKREYSALPLQSARIAQSRESNLDSCRPMSLGSYRLESRRDLQTANKVCGLYPFSPERETCCILPVNQLSRAYFLTKWKKCNIVSLFLQIHIVESTIHHSLMRMDSRQRIVSNACKSLIYGRRVYFKAGDWILCTMIGYRIPERETCCILHLRTALGF